MSFINEHSVQFMYGNAEGNINSVNYDIHGSGNTVSTKSDETSDFEPPSTEGGTTTDLESMMGMAESKVCEGSVPVRNGELILPGVNQPQTNLVLDDDFQRKTVPSSSNFLEKEDQMSFSFYKSRPKIIQQLAISDSASPGTYLSQFNMCPNQVPVDGLYAVDDSYSFSPMEFLYWSHAMWHGSLKAKFQFVGPLNYTCRIAIHFLYGREFDSAAFNYEALCQYPTIFKTFGSSDREQIIEIADISKYLWKVREDFDVNVDSTTENFLQKSNGTVVISLATPLSGINIPLTSPPQLLIWLVGGSDLQFERFQPLPGLTSIAPTASDRIKAVRLRQVSESSEESVVVIEKPMKRMSVKTGKAHSAPAPNALLIAAAPVEMQAETAASEQPVQESGTVVEGTQVQAVPVTIEPMKPLTRVPPQQLGLLAKKFNHLGNFALVPATPSIASYKIPTQVLVGQQKLMATTGRYFKGDVRFRFTVTTGAFSGGLLIAAYIPYGIMPSDLRLERLTTLPHTLIDVSSNVPRELVVPYHYIKEFFDTSDVNELMGTLVIQQVVALINPSTGAKPTTLVVQVRWDNFETFIPMTIPSCISTGSYVYGNAQSGPAKSFAGDLNKMTTSCSSNTIAEVNAKTPVAVLPVNKKPHKEKTLLNLMYRPTLMFSRVLNFEIVPPALGAPNAGSFVFYELPCFPDLPDMGAEPQDGWSSFYDTLQQFYSTFTGDTTFDIVVRGTEGLGLSYCVFSIASSAPLKAAALFSMLPVPFYTVSGDSNPFWPSRLGATPPADSYTIASCLPITSGFLPSKIRVAVPCIAQTRHVFTEYAQNESVDPIRPPILRCGIMIWQPPGVETTGTVILDVYRSASNGARLAHFTGIPRLYVDCLHDAASAGVGNRNYQGSYMPIP
jgi:hypothetical protein